MTDAVTVEAPSTPAAPALEGGVLVVSSTPAVDAAALAAAETDKAPETPKDEAAADTGPAAVVYEQTGDVGLDMALNFVGKFGIDVDNPAMAAALAGDFSLLKAELASHGAKAAGWEQYIALGEKAFADAQAHDAAAHAAVQAAVFDVAGGQEQWAQIQTWARGAADPAEIKQINEQLSGTPLQARAMATLLRTMYDEKAYAPPADPLRPNPSTKPGQAVATPLNKREATALSNQLVARFGSTNIDQNPEYRAIWARVRS
jgi:hypothetical protein